MHVGLMCMGHRTKALLGWSVMGGSTQDQHSQESGKSWEQVAFYLLL